MVSRTTPLLDGPATVDMALGEVDTPSLLLDLDAFECNVAAMASAVHDAGVRLRPHAKAHKCPEIAKRQLAAGAVGVCCQKVSEAEAMVAGGVSNILISNEVVGWPKLERVAALAKRADVAICVDNPVNAADLDRAARAAGVRLDVLVEIDVGARRCGAAPGAPALELARLVSSFDHLRFAGLQAYQGAAQHVRSIADRRAAIEQSIGMTRAARDLLRDHGLECGVVTGGGTGSFVFELRSGVYNEVQPGSYVFMDADYGRNAWDGFPRFRQSLYVWTTVMSAPFADRVVVDAGLKAHSVDSGMPLVADWPGVKYVRVSDEHGVLACETLAPRLGDKLRLVPGHCDPTVNLHDRLVCVRGGMVEAVWPISARGAMY